MNAPLPRRAALIMLAITGVLVLPAVHSRASAPELRLNQIQVIGTHNSYHLEAPQSEAGPISVVGGPVTKGLQYSHAPLDQQFGGERVRQMKLDVYADPKGGQYAKPPIRVLTGEKADYDPAMNEPGTKVLHIA